LRGGYWGYDADLARCAYRGNYYPNNAADAVGIRCVRGL
jgi:formylglycine-generating enzyme required for sulfatase activity